MSIFLQHCRVLFAVHFAYKIFCWGGALKAMSVSTTQLLAHVKRRFGRSNRADAKLGSHCARAVCALFHTLF